MTYFDVFNGDADGICALIQWRLAHPADSRLVTGVKRDIALLERVEAAQGDEVTVLDISMDKNRDALERCLAAGARVMYVDHHFAGDIPEHSGLEAHINTAADVCTSLLINGQLKSRYAGWAIAGAFGDNLLVSAEALASSQQFAASAVEQLKALGTYMNYNGYGASLDDLHIAPAELYRAASQYVDPLDFIAQAGGVFEALAAGYEDDMAKAQGADVIVETPAVQALQLPDAAWSRRVSGVYGNALANKVPERAHAILTSLPDNAFLVSVRAPLANKQGADALCRQFDTGGGRAGAAGINRLPASEVERFLAAFAGQYSA